MKWTGEYEVNANDVDFNNVVSVSNYLRYMQDAANREMEDDGLSYMQLFEKGLAFVLSRIRMSFYTPVYSHERLQVQSWACESKGAQFNRCYRILRDGSIVAEAVSVWALCGVADHRLHRVNEFKFSYCTDEMLDLDLPARFRIPEDVSLRLVGERVVEYADIDLNGHMNNTKYPDILCGYIGDMRGQRVISMALSFVSEAPLHEALKIYAGSSDGVWYVRTVRENGQTNVEAEIITETITEKRDLSV
ncbi:MAG: acyl-[acyl-carrier-protein] thioesterase [Eubacteriales bacterium]